MNKPITVAREDYLNTIVEASNNAGLPAFVKIEVLNLVLDKLKDIAKEEYTRDLSQWSAEQNSIVTEAPDVPVAD